MISILLSYYFQSQHLIREKHYENAKKRLIEALNFYEENILLAYNEDIGLSLRLKMIHLGLARRYCWTNFELAQDHFKKAYFPNPTTKRERKHNSLYFMKDWKFFVNIWIKRGKEKKDFLDI